MDESWIQLFTVIIANFTVVWWFRKESRDDWKHMDSKMDQMNKEHKEFKEAIRLDMKDFHERLLEIEKSRYR